ncbi:ankyrin repeat-containing domain protein [Cordyceps fumosorosea ARSEF 2679]|uniref:Ankyrin repeat-containing domain protein n=1 Tax=Cordyceps fumosorosea (strain ARSEF 2679) TaxID=1081104 RepID=A0A162K4N3_CORFA|nr:ankyrin repeat-containing domain protein [Cordyceps fumosorosea ARSEF 2679]OAA53278.1 ankyrin repeat-containing domain protein [Cordyceps fumosorosea ARSEF 2679]
MESVKKSTALLEALNKKHIVMAGMLATAGADVDIAPNTSNIPVFLALKSNWFDIFKLMVSVGNANLTVVNENGHGLLTEAARLNDIDMVESLMSYSSRLGTRSPEKSTPLHQAILHNNLTMFSMLLESSHTSPNAPCEGNQTPLDLACERGATSFVAALLDDGRMNRQLPTKDKGCLVLRALKMRLY